MSWLAVAVGGGALVGVGKAELVDAPRAERQRKLAAETQRYSPWTHMQAQPVEEAKPFDAAMQGAATGANAFMGVQSMQAQNKLAGAQTDWLKTNPYNASTGAASAMGTGAATGLQYNQNPRSFWGI